MTSVLFPEPIGWRNAKGSWNDIGTTDIDLYTHQGYDDADAFEDPGAYNSFIVYVKKILEK